MNSSRHTQKDYEHMGKLLVGIYETGYISRKELYRVSFIRGVLMGLGSVIGATILIALLLWVVSLFDRVPLVNRFIDAKKIQQTVQPVEN